MQTTQTSKDIKKKENESMCGLEVKTPHAITIENYVQAGYSSYSVVLENQLLKPHFALQSGDDVTDQTTSKLFAYMQQYMSRYLSSMSSSESEWWTRQTENVVTVFHWYGKCTEVSDYIQLSLTAYKLFTGRSYTTFIRRRFELIFGNLQSDATSELLHTLRKAFDTVESISENPLLQKLTGLYSYLLVQGFLSRFGLELNDEDYSRLEQKALYAQYSSKKGLWMNILDTSLFMCERFHEWKRTGVRSKHCT